MSESANEYIFSRDEASAVIATLRADLTASVARAERAEIRADLAEQQFAKISKHIDSTERALERKYDEAHELTASVKRVVAERDAASAAMRGARAALGEEWEVLQFGEWGDAEVCRECFMLKVRGAHQEHCSRGRAFAALVSVQPDDKETQ